MKKTIISCVLASVLLASEPLLAAIPDAAQSRPRVGLVLGGGGARGAAHIGVLKELERQRIPVDAIVGTSMGAIVGGLYASGMTVDELETLVASLDWSAAFSDANKRENMRYRRKQDDAEYPIGFEMGYRDSKFQLPKGVVQGQKLSLILRRLTVDVADVSDFDDLPIPYRAVASDLATGEAVVLGEGDLALAIRASMSAPGVFAPAELDGRILVDGGLVGNVPIDAIRQMDVDVVIAVDVEFPLYQADQLQSAINISAQMLTILIRKETRRQLDLLGDDDYLIRPRLGQFGSADFANITQAVEPGETATRELRGRLSTLSLPAEDFGRHLAARQRAPIERTLDFVRVVDDGALSPRVLESRLGSSPGDAVDPERLAADANGLYGLKLYEQVDYRLVAEGERNGVEFVTRRKAWGPNFLQFGLSLQDNLDGDTAFNVATRLTRAGMNRLGAEWRTDLQLGTRPLAVSEFYQPLSFDSRYFVAPRLAVGQRNFDAFVGADVLARFRVTEGEAGFDVGRELGRWGEARLGVFRGLGSQRLKIGNPELPNNDFQTGGVFASFNVDTLDNAQIPLTGSRLNVEWLAERRGLGADDQYEALDARYTGAWTGGRHTLNIGLRYADSRDSEQLVRNYFTLGGFLNLSGLAPGELSGPHAALARLVYYRRSGELKGTLTVPFYVGASLEAGNTWMDRTSLSLDSALINGSLFLGADTFLGPVFFAAGFGEGGNRSLYVSIGNTPGLRR